MRLIVPNSYDYEPGNLSMLEGLNSLKFTFSLGPTFIDIGPPPALQLSLAAWRTYPRLGAGTYDFVSVQKLSSAVRLSGAIQLVRSILPTACTSPRVDVAEVLTGDMQVSTVGTPFTTSTISVKASTSFPEKPSVGASVALASENIKDEALDTGIDGQKAATLVDANGNATFSLTQGTTVGIKRFMVKARS